MISYKPSTPLPEPIDDSYLVVDSTTCELPQGTFSRVEWFIATLKLYELLRRTLNMLYDNVGKQCEENPADLRPPETLLQVQYITQLDAELQGFRLRVPRPLRWDVPISEAQPQFLREQYLLKARQGIINTLSVRVTNHICRYLYLKLLIYRPVLSKSLHRILSTGTERGLSGAWICANFTMDRSVFCVQSAIDLIDLVHETCHTNLASV
jgi:hypothetical protein